MNGKSGKVAYVKGKLQNSREKKVKER